MKVLITALACVLGLFIWGWIPDGTTLVDWVENNRRFRASLQALSPWLVMTLFYLLGRLLIAWARKRKSTAFALGIFVQMFLPDPYAQRTIEQVSEVKKNKREHCQEAGDKDDER